MQTNESYPAGQEDGSIVLTTPLGGDSTMSLSTAPLTAVKNWEVGTIDDLMCRQASGDNLDIHHVPQKHAAQQVVPGYNPLKGPAIAVPHDIHLGFNANNISGPYNGDIRRLINNQVRALKRAGAPKESISQLRRLIRQKNIPQ